MDAVDFDRITESIMPIARSNAVKIAIDPSVTEEQRCDPRFWKLLADAETFFNSQENNHYKFLLALHECAHSFWAKRSGATSIRHRGPTMIWDTRPKYNCPAISKSSTAWTPAVGSSVVANLKANIAGYVCRRELTDSPNDHIAIERDLQDARNWFDRHVGTGDDAFKAAIAEAEAEILLDLKSQSVVDEIWSEAKRFVEEVFQAKPTPKTPKIKRIKVGRNEICPCGSGKKFKKCCFGRLSPEMSAA
jgi:SEC-C motif